MTAQSTFRLDANGFFDHAAAIANLSSHAVPGLHHFNPATKQLSRWIQVDGTQQWVQIELADACVIVTTDSADWAFNKAIAARVRFWFDLDTDLAPINAHLAQDPIFADQVSRRPGIRITRHHAPFEGTILAVLGQQVTLSTGRLFAARLVEAFGTTPHATGLRMFPTAHAIASVPVNELRAALKLTNSRARTVHEVAEFFAERGPDAEHKILPVREDLTAVYGIGPWTLDVLAIRADTNADAFPASDAVLRRMMHAAEHCLGEDKKRDAAHIAAWSPYRSYAAQRLWAMHG